MRWPIVFLLLSLNLYGMTGFESNADYALLYQVESDTVLYQKKAHDRMPPSSMTKMMTIYVVFDALTRGVLRPEDTFSVSLNAYKKEGSRMFLEPRSVNSLHRLIQGTVVSSGNDAATTIAEGMAGSEQQFSRLMNITASKMKLRNSHFCNASGLPEEDHYSSAFDLMMIAKHTIAHFPDLYKTYYAQREFTHNKINQRSQNRLLWATNLNVDGGKTGHSKRAGYGQIFSLVTRDGSRLIGVVNGLKTDIERNRAALELAKWGVNSFRSFRIAKESFAQDIDLQDGRRIDVMPSSDVWLTVKEWSEVAIAVERRQTAATSYRAGDVAAVLSLASPQFKKNQKIELHVVKDVPPVGRFNKILYSMKKIVGWPEKEVALVSQMPKKVAGSDLVLSFTNAQSTTQ